MRYLLDTNIIIGYSRKGRISTLLEEDYFLLSGEHRLYVSTVTLGELDSFIKRNNIGVRKQAYMNQVLEQCYQIDISQTEIIVRYGDIDAFSQGKLKVEGHDFTSRNMGKNDLWIAATASHFGLTLLTTDKDFHHLDKAYLDLSYIEVSQS